jgi:hypothetical protein
MASAIQQCSPRPSRLPVGVTGRIEQLDAFYKKELWLFHHDGDAPANKQNRGDL